MSDSPPLDLRAIQERVETDYWQVPWPDGAARQADAKALLAAVGDLTARLHTQSDELEQVKESRVAPSVPCVAPMGSTAEGGQGVQSPPVPDAGLSPFAVAYFRSLCLIRELVALHRVRGPLTPLGEELCRRADEFVTRNPLSSAAEADRAALTARLHQREVKIIRELLDRAAIVDMDASSYRAVKDFLEPLLWANSTPDPPTGDPT